MILRPLLLAVQFLTRIPVPVPGKVTERDVGRSLLFYPLVGLFIGGVLFGLHHLLSDTAPLLRAAIIVTVWVAISGGLHLDGLADMADAWVGGHGDRERTLAIMKDPTCGPMGVMALMLMLLLKVAALEQLGGQELLMLIAAPLLGRAALVLLFLTTPYVRKGGLGETLSNALPRRAGWLIMMIVAVSVLLLVNHAWVVMAALAIVFVLFRLALIARLGGTTGDTAGALLEVCEVTVILSAALL